MLRCVEEARTPPGQTESSPSLLSYLGQALASAPWCVSTFLHLHSTAIHPASDPPCCDSFVPQRIPAFLQWLLKVGENRSSGSQSVHPGLSTPVRAASSPNEDPPGSPSELMCLKLLSAQQTCFHRLGIKYFLLSLWHRALSILLYLASICNIFFKTVFQGRWVNVCVLNLTQWTKWTPGFASHLSTIIVMKSKIQLKIFFFK